VNIGLLTRTIRRSVRLQNSCSMPTIIYYEEIILGVKVEEIQNITLGGLIGATNLEFDSFAPGYCTSL
jgi:hypothetical protein